MSELWRKYGGDLFGWIAGLCGIIESIRLEQYWGVGGWLLFLLASILLGSYNRLLKHVIGEWDATITELRRERMRK